MCFIVVFIFYRPYVVIGTKIYNFFNTYIFLLSSNIYQIMRLRSTKLLFCTFRNVHIAKYICKPKGHIFFQQNLKRVILGTGLVLLSCNNNNILKVHYYNKILNTNKSVCTQFLNPSVAYGFKNEAK